MMSEPVKLDRLLIRIADTNALEEVTRGDAMALLVRAQFHRLLFTAKRLREWMARTDSGNVTCFSNVALPELIAA